MGEGRGRLCGTSKAPQESGVLSQEQQNPLCFKWSPKATEGIDMTIVVFPEQS